MITLIVKAQFYVTESYVRTFFPLASIPYKLNGHMRVISNKILKMLITSSVLHGFIKHVVKIVIYKNLSHFLSQSETEVLK